MSIITKAKVNSIQRTIASHREAYDNHVKSIASDIRREIIIPACREHNAKFVAGNGTWFFSLREQARDLDLVWLVPILEILNTDVYSFNSGTEGDVMSRLGYYVASVKNP